MRDHEYDSTAALHLLGIVLAGLAFALGAWTAS